MRVALSCERERLGRCLGRCRCLGGERFPDFGARSFVWDLEGLAEYPVAISMSINQREASGLRSHYLDKQQK